MIGHTHKSRPVAAVVTLLFWSVACAAGSAFAEAAPSQPNILLIVADDMGWKDVGFHGSEIDTPHIDRIAQRGIALDRFYVQPTCSPTRAALMTGKSPARLGIVRPIAKNLVGGLPLGERTLADRLAEAGYQTFMTGKWHLGHSDTRYFPQRRGFDHFYGHVTGGIGYWDHNHGGGHDWQRNGVTVREDGYSTTLITDEAIALLSARDTARPTFLYVAYNAPHLPNEAPQAAIDRQQHIADENRGVHAAMVSELDTGIGRLLAALDAEDMAEETLIWFISDNGGLNRSYQPAGLVTLLDGLVGIFGEPLPIAALEFLRANIFEGASDNRPLRGGKTSVYEGGTRVPAAVWWPGHLAGGTSERFVTAQDVLPTVLDAAGLRDEIPDDLDGASQLEALAAGVGDTGARSYLTLGMDGTALHRGPWKLVMPQSPLPFSSAPPELYQIREDPGETRDLASEHPERVAELSALIAEWPMGESIHGSFLGIATDPDRFGGEETREPWAEAAQ